MVKFRVFLQVIFGLISFAQINCDENPDNNYSNFESSVDVCNKCSCSVYSKLFILNCAERDLHNTLSNWPDHANKTLRATFSHNIITTLEKFPATNCSASISLDHCGIKFLAPGLFENMRNVEYVDLSHNLITIDELSAEKFKGPYRQDENEPIEVTHLSLAYNKIHSLPKNVFEHMPKIKHLNLEGNNFKVLDQQTQIALSSVPALEHLSLANNGLKDLPDQMFTSLRRLVTINLSHNRMDFIPNALSHVESLKVLNFDSNMIFELTTGVFDGVPNLVELSLNNLTNVVEVHSRTFEPLKKLRKLHISNNAYLEVFEPDAFGSGGSQTLKELYMNNNDLIDIPSVLVNWSNLENFEFNGNPMMCTCNLHNITKRLNSKITRNKNGPYCIGDNGRSRQVFSLGKEVCSEKYNPSYDFNNGVRNKFSIIRVSLITLSLIVVTGSFIAAVVCYAKQRKYDFLGREHLFSRSTAVLYNPLDRQSM